MLAAAPAGLGALAAGRTGAALGVGAALGAALAGLNGVGFAAGFAAGFDAGARMVPPPSLPGAVRNPATASTSRWAWSRRLSAAAADSSTSAAFCWVAWS